MFQGSVQICVCMFFGGEGCAVATEYQVTMLSNFSQIPALHWNKSYCNIPNYMPVLCCLLQQSPNRLEPLQKPASPWQWYCYGFPHQCWQPKQSHITHQSATTIEHACLPGSRLWDYWLANPNSAHVVVFQFVCSLSMYRNSKIKPLSYPWSQWDNFT